jgi:hypothetical protein
VIAPRLIVTASVLQPPRANVNLMHPRVFVFFIVHQVLRARCFSKKVKMVPSALSCCPHDRNSFALSTKARRASILAVIASLEFWGVCIGETVSTERQYLVSMVGGRLSRRADTNGRRNVNVRCSLLLLLLAYQWHLVAEGCVLVYSLGSLSYAKIVDTPLQTEAPVQV